jgi:hypothetical protein
VYAEDSMSKRTKTSSRRDRSRIGVEVLGQERLGDRLTELRELQGDVRVESFSRDAVHDVDVHLTRLPGRGLGLHRLAEVVPRAVTSLRIGLTDGATSASTLSPGTNRRLMPLNGVCVTAYRATSESLSAIRVLLNTSSLCLWTGDGRDRKTGLGLRRPRPCQTRVVRWKVRVSRTRSCCCSWNRALEKRDGRGYGCTRCRGRSPCRRSSARPADDRHVGALLDTRYSIMSLSPRDAA